METRFRIVMDRAEHFSCSHSVANFLVQNESNRVVDGITHVLSAATECKARDSHMPAIDRNYESILRSFNIDCRMRLG